jgi:hypothetical protein
MSVKDSIAPSSILCTPVTADRSKSSHQARRPYVKSTGIVQIYQLVSKIGWHGRLVMGL